MRLMPETSVGLDVADPEGAVDVWYILVVALAKAGLFPCTSEGQLCLTVCWMCHYCLPFC